jgi:hypothetical protein
MKPFRTRRWCVDIWQIQLTPWSWVLLQKLPITQIFKKFSETYGTRRFITMFTTARQQFLSWARWIQSTPPHLISLRSILKLCSHLSLDLQIFLFLSEFPTKILYAFLISSLLRPELLWDPPASYPMGTRGSFLRGKAVGAWSWPLTSI